MTKVYFATNRAADNRTPNGFGSAIVDNDPNAITYAIADVANPASGRIDAISERSAGRFSDIAAREIVDSGKNLLVFIHGFDNNFEAAISRAAANADFYRATGAAAADTVVLAFTWPSMGRVVEARLGALDAAYMDDQRMAGASGFHLGHFFNEVDRLRLHRAQDFPMRRLFLLAHSMGNWALQAALTWWYQTGQPKDDMFDEIILAAADEVADTFEAPAGYRLSRIADLAKRVTIYSSQKDAILQLSASALVNGLPRLGQNGPKDKESQGKYPPQLFRMMDCTHVSDFFPPFLSEETHQYYRLSHAVRTDIAAVMAGSAVPIGGLGALSASLL